MSVLLGKKRRIALAHRWLSMPSRQREMYFLCDVLHLSEKQAAEIIGISIGAVRSHLARARQLLAEDDRA